DSKRNNKIIFDESTGMSKKANPIKGTRQSFDVETGGNQLFESDEELEDNFNFESRYKNDKRFVLNESFINDEDEDKSNDNEVKDFQQISAEEEKKRQFEILEEVLSGKLKQKLLHRRGMLRFDPTQSNHLKYEIINIQNSDAIKRKSEDSQIDDNDIVHPPKASKKVFYKVSDDLKETLQNAEKISLLNLFGKPEDTPNFEKKEQKVAIKISDLNQEPNPFQYDSSDDENLKEQDTYEEGSYKINSNIPVNISKFWTEPFFFRNDDFRLQEGLDFMKRMMFEKKSEFMQLRKNLKYIIKAKVRNNKRRNKCFKKKLGGSKKKKILRIKKALKR
ncbi:RNA-binding protein, partial [Asbolus verrucosus]